MLLLKILHLISLIVSLLFFQFVSSSGRKKYDPEKAKWLYVFYYFSHINSYTRCIARYIPKFNSYFLFKNHEVSCDESENKCRYTVYISPQKARIIIMLRSDNSFSRVIKEGISKNKKFIFFEGIGFVNKHFAASFYKLWPFLDFIFREHRLSKYKVTLVGHSLGGALATLTAAKLLSSGYKISSEISLYTYGAPRVGNPDFARKFDEKILNSWRIIFENDIVPHYPKCAKVVSKYVKFSYKFSFKMCDRSNKNSYYHNSLEVWYPKGFKGKYKYVECLGNPKNEDRYCSNMYRFDTINIFDYKSSHYNYFGNVVSVFGKYLKEKYNNHCTAE